MGKLVQLHDVCKKKTEIIFKRRCSRKSFTWKIQSSLNSILDLPGNEKRMTTGYGTKDGFHADAGLMSASSLVGFRSENQT